MLDVGLQVQNKQPQQVFFIKLKLSKKWDGIQVMLNDIGKS